MDSSKTTKTNKTAKTGKPSIFSRIGRFFKEAFGETKKLSWPTKKELISYTLTVIAFVAFFAIIIGLLDAALNVGYTAMNNIEPQATEAPVESTNPTEAPAENQESADDGEGE